MLLLSGIYTSFNCINVFIYLSTFVKDAGWLMMKLLDRGLRMDHGVRILFQARCSIQHVNENRYSRREPKVDSAQ